MKKVVSFLLVAFVSFGVLLLGGCEQVKDKYLVSTYVNGARFGDVNGGNGTYDEGTEITITAIPRQTMSTNNENVFVAWIHDYKVVSSEKQYTFLVSNETAGDYIALFQNNQTDLEYVAPLGFSLSYGVFDNTEVSIDVTSYSFYIGYYEDELFELFSFDAESNLAVTVDNMYDADQLPFAFDKTSDLYVKLVINYARNEFNYTATATKKLHGVALGTMPDIQLEEEFTTANMVGFDNTLTYSQKPSFTLTISKLANLLQTEEE